MLPPLISTPMDFASNPLQVHRLDWNLNSMITYCSLKYTQLTNFKVAAQKAIKLRLPASLLFPRNGGSKKIVSSPSVCDLLHLPLFILMQFMYSKGSDPHREGSPGTFLSALSHFNIYNTKYQTRTAAAPFAVLTSQTQHSRFSDTHIDGHT